MAITKKIEEYIVDLARAIGDTYDALVGGIGDEDTPGTALFELAQLGDVASKQLPRFGLVKKLSGLGFEVTYSSAQPYFVSVSAGEVGFQGQRLAIDPQNVPISRAFAHPYSPSANYQYGVRLGFPRDEALRASSTYSTIVTQNVASGDSYLPIRDADMIEMLGFPLLAYVGTLFVIFSGFNEDKTALKLDAGFFNGSAYGKFFGSVASQTKVRFLYSPRVMAICGLPVLSSTTDPGAFHYFPPIPKDWLPIADVLVTDPFNPSAAYIRRTAVEWPASDILAPVFSDDSAKKIVSATASSRSALRRVRDAGSVSNLVQSLRDYSSAIADSPDANFREVWSRQPFRATSYYARGVSFDNLERVEFPLSFARAYLEATSEDIQHTMGLFRGDLYDTTHVLVGNATVTGLELSSIASTDVASTNSRGTYVYGVSAVMSTGETPPSYVSGIASAATPSYFQNEITWTAVPNALFYHVYRRSSVAGEQSEYRLTAPNQILGSGKFTNAPASPTAYENLDTAYEAAKFTAQGASVLGGITLLLKSSGVITNASDYLTIQVRADDGSGKPTGTVIATGTSITYGQITTTPREILCRFDAQNLTLGATYWIVLTRNAAPTGAQVQIGISTTGTGLWATSTTGALSSWTTQNSKALSYDLHGYLDNGAVGDNPISRGVKTTGRIALRPRRLSVYVPQIEFPSDYFGGPFTGESGDAISTTEAPVTKNELSVTVIARRGISGSPVTLTTTIPKGTPGGTRFLLGVESQRFDRVDDIQVRPGSSLTVDSSGKITWSKYDFITVETSP